MRKKIHHILDKLRLKGIAGVLDSELDLADKNGTPVSEFLYRLLCQEHKHRRERSLMYRLQQAKIPWNFSLNSFPFELQPGVRKHQIQALGQLAFIQNAENIVFIGNPGVGKSGLAVGLLRNAVVEGYRGRFYNAQDLLDELYSSLADRTTPKFIRRLFNYDLLVIDELGYLTLKPEQVNAFFKLMGERYGKKSTIITTNLDYQQWYELFDRQSLVDVLLDRLKHRCITIKIDGPSLRIPASED